MRPRAALFVAAILLASITHAFADTAYVYSGNPYNYFDLYTSSYMGSNISGSFVVPQTLDPNLSLASISPSWFSFTDGLKTQTLLSPNTSYQFLVSTNASGDITAWNLSFFTSGGTDAFKLHTCNVSFFDGSPYSMTTVSTDTLVRDQSTCMHSIESQYWVTETASVSNQAGTWTRIEGVPEPATILLLGSGILGVLKQKHLAGNRG
ncbi:MAG TPA: PEP-CTERM sorting domain-containing protein [Terriglobales bacterium]|nr:PEP-CTERM sorting domain-containing protein [Terriglobales bacterium]